MPDSTLIQTILVPQGAEYQAVCRGLKQAGASPTVIPIPMGMAPVQQFLTDWRTNPLASQPAPHASGKPSVLVMGLCGSLRPAHQLGDWILYEKAISLTPGEAKAWTCSAQLTERLQARFSSPPPCVVAWTSAQFVHLASAKRQLSQTYGVDVVDMEATAILETLAATGAEIAMLRVVSDTCNHDLPDLSAVISSVGTLLPAPLAATILRSPLRTFRLVRGSLIGLRALQRVTATLFTP